MKIHVLGVPHTKTTEEFSTCAFTQKTLTLCKMLTRRGHHVIHYGVEGSNPECTENVDVMPHDVWAKQFGHPGKDSTRSTFQGSSLRTTPAMPRTCGRRYSTAPATRSPRSSATRGTVRSLRRRRGSRSTESRAASVTAARGPRGASTRATRGCTCTWGRGAWNGAQVVLERYPQRFRPGAVRSAEEPAERRLPVPRTIEFRQGRGHRVRHGEGGRGEDHNRRPGRPDAVPGAAREVPAAGRD